MNKLIAELAMKAGFEVSATSTKHAQSGIELFKLEKFAELIINECIKDLPKRIETRYAGSKYDHTVAYGMEVVLNDIREKFIY